MKIYELTYFVSPNITLEETQEESKNLEDKIQQKGGVILRSEKPVAKTLSYQIKKSGSGFFSILEFQIEPESIEDIINELKENKNLLRHMLLVKNPARKFKERRQRIKPTTDAIIKEIKEEIKEEVIKPIQEEIEKPAAKKVKSTKSKEKAEIEDIDKKLDEILSE